MVVGWYLLLRCAATHGVVIVALLALASKNSAAPCAYKVIPAAPARFALRRLYIGRGPTSTSTAPTNLWATPTFHVRSSFLGYKTSQLWVLRGFKGLEFLYIQYANYIIKHMLSQACAVIFDTQRHAVRGLHLP